VEYKPAQAVLIVYAFIIDVYYSIALSVRSVAFPMLHFSGTQPQAYNESQLNLIPWQTENVVPGSKVSHENGQVCLILCSV
jgi:hypothetical protein